jgi:regulator of protease activity HflC (stomatin/prohibitin superfamily)
MIAFYVIKQYERAVVFKLGKVTGQARGPGLSWPPHKRAESLAPTGQN